METKKKFFNITHASFDHRAFPWAYGYGPIDNMPFLHPLERERMDAFWKINPSPAGLEVGDGKCRARVWPDFLGCGGGPPRLFVSEEVVNSLTKETILPFRQTKMPVGRVLSKNLKAIPPPNYYVLEMLPGIETNWIKTGVPVDAQGKPILNPLPKPWPPFMTWMKLNTWNGADLFGWPTSDGWPSTRLLCTERIVEIAKRDKWTNVKFDPVWAS
jgi:hypothetical protein